MLYDKYSISSQPNLFPPMVVTEHNLDMDLMELNLSLFLCKYKERSWHLQWIAVFFESLSFGTMIGIKRMLFNYWLNEWMTYYYRHLHSL